MKHIQTTLEDEDFNKLRLFCGIVEITRQDLVYYLVGNFLSADAYKKVDSSSKGLRRLGELALINFNVDELKKDLFSLNDDD